MLACLAAPASADYSAGEEAYYRGDYATAFRELTPLAESGDAFSEYFLGLMYAQGAGVPVDYVLAYMWFNLAAAQGEKDATDLLGSLAKKMTPAQIEEAQKLAREWKPR